VNKRDRLTVAMLLLILALVLALGAGTLLGVAALPQQVTEGFTLPAGPQYTITLTYALFTGGSMSVTYRVLANDSIDVFLLNQTLYDAILHGEFPGTLNESEGSSGNASAVLPGGGNYYVLFVHAPGFEFTTERGEFTVRVAGLAATRFLEGSVAAVLATGAAVAGVYERRQARPGVVRGLNDRPR